MIQLKRVYEEPGSRDGVRFLVDRLWPRGLRKEDVPMRAWLKELGPSTELRKWFAHDPAKWSEFQRKYQAEISKQSEALEPLLEAARRGPITLLYSAHDPDHNNAVVLKHFLEKKLAHHVQR